MERTTRFHVLVIAMFTAAIISLPNRVFAASKTDSCARCEGCQQCGLQNQHQAELRRAGHPRCVAWYAKPSFNSRYAGYYVGGSTPFWKRGDPRRYDEGTWGWDYWGKWVKRRISLAWRHGRNADRAYSRYDTDGPKLISRE